MIDDKLVYSLELAWMNGLPQNTGINFLVFFAGQLIELYLLCMFYRKISIEFFYFAADWLELVCSILC